MHTKIWNTHIRRQHLIIRDMEFSLFSLLEFFEPPTEGPSEIQNMTNISKQYLNHLYLMSLGVQGPQDCHWHPPPTPPPNISFCYLLLFVGLSSFYRGIVFHIKRSKTADSWMLSLILWQGGRSGFYQNLHLQLSIQKSWARSSPNFFMGRGG